MKNELVKINQRQFIAIKNVVGNRIQRAGFDSGQAYINRLTTKYSFSQPQKDILHLFYKINF